MKKTFLSLLLLAFGVNAMAQQAIQLRSADKAECVKSDMRSLKASFSFSTIEAESMNTQRVSSLCSACLTPSLAATRVTLRSPS